MEVMVVGEGFSQTKSLHDEKARAIHQAPRLVRPFPIQLESLFLKGVGHGDDVDPRIILEKVDGSYKLTPCGSSCQPVPCLSDNPVSQYKGGSLLDQLSPQVRSSRMQGIP